MAGVARALPAAALHPQGFFVTNRALELCEPDDVLPLARSLAPLGPELATDPRGVHHLSKLTDLLVRPRCKPSRLPVRRVLTGLRCARLAIWAHCWTEGLLHSGASSSRYPAQFTEGQYACITLTYGGS